MYGLMLVDGIDRERIRYVGKLLENLGWLVLSSIFPQARSESTKEGNLELMTSLLFNIGARGRFAQPIAMIGGPKLSSLDEARYVQPLEFLKVRLGVYTADASRDIKFWAETSEVWKSEANSLAATIPPFLADQSLDCVTGSLSPRWILVGDRQNHHHGLYRLPFHAGKLSSRWLHEALVSLQAGPNDVSLVNAHGERSGETLRYLVSRNPGARVIALGANASSWLDDFGLIHYQVPHPSWARRFQTNTPSLYQETLATAMMG